MWKIYNDEGRLEPKQLGTPLKGHKNAILKTLWPLDEGSDSLTLFSCGAQNKQGRGEIIQWDLHEFKVVRHHHGHKSIVNDIDARDGTLVSASDDGTVKMWDFR